MPTSTLNAPVAETDHLTRLQALTAALGNVASVEQVAELFLTHGLAALNADAGILSLLTGDGTEFAVAGFLGHSPDEVDPWLHFAADALVPIGDAVRSRQPIVIEKFVPSQAHCPQSARSLKGGNSAVVALPLLGRDRVLGGFGLSFPTERSFSETDLAFLRTLASLCALAVERVRLLEAERAALLKAEREVQERLRAQGERSRLFAVGADLLAIAGFDGRIRWVSPAWERTLGWTPEELTGRPYLDFIHPDDHAPTLAEAGKLVEGHETVKFENRYRRKDGTYRWINWKAYPFPSEQLIYAGGTDITDTKHEEETVAVTEERFRLLIEVVPQLVWSSLPNGHIDYCNPRWLNYTGLTHEHVQGDGWTAALHPDDFATTMAAWRRVTTSPGEYQVEQRLRNRSGEYRWFLTRALPLRDGEGRVIKWFGTCTDIEDRRRAEEDKRLLERKLLEAQKLESLGVLAGGIAHDFNNLLTPILGNASLMETGLPAESPLRQSLDEIIQASERAADLCRQMLAYSGRGRFVLTMLDLNQVVREMVGLLRMSVSKKAALRLDLAEELPLLLADATQIRQVVMNLVLNASEAIGDRPGTIRVGTRSQLVDRAYVAGSSPGQDLEAGEYVSLEIADTGCGMDEETRRKVFDPFFTTKFTGRGLGLAAVMGIVRGHKGTICVASEPGVGTTLRLLLPAGRDEARERPFAPTGGESWKGSGKVLVADDEEGVREVAARMLRSLGLQVVQARDGQEALDLFRATPNDFRLVLLDLTMPKLDGEEVFRTLHLLRPELPIVLMSGFSDHEAGGRFAGRGLAGFLSKPFKVEDLVGRVRAALEVTKS